jgi:pSer/pThr/pTyr-binding forkhead associated (FHA) protein
VYCQRCGFSNPEGAHFCARCGTALVAEDQTAVLRPVDTEGLPEAEVSLPTPLKAGQAVLVVKRGPNAGAYYVLDKDVVSAGRHPESEIFLDDITVSRRHAEFRREADTYCVVDLGSLNGTYVNRQRIEKVELSNGDEIQIGRFKLVFYGR